jgi:hypothetical protein
MRSSYQLFGGHSVRQCFLTASPRGVSGAASDWQRTAPHTHPPVTGIFIG